MFCWRLSFSGNLWPYFRKTERMENQALSTAVIRHDWLRNGGLINDCLSLGFDVSWPSVLGFVCFSVFIRTQRLFFQSLFYGRVIEVRLCFSSSSSFLSLKWKSGFPHDGSPLPFILFLCLFLSLWPFQLYFIPLIPRQFSASSFCFPGLNFALLVLSTINIYLFMKVSVNLDIIICG